MLKYAVESATHKNFCAVAHFVYGYTNRNIGYVYSIDIRIHHQNIFKKKKKRKKIGNMDTDSRLTCNIDYVAAFYVKRILCV